MGSGIRSTSQLPPRTGSRSHPTDPPLYVASNSGGTITPVTLTTGTLSAGTPGTPIPAGPEPTAIAISPDGSTAYVTDFGTGQLMPITLATGTAGTPIAVGPEPSAIALVPSSGITTAPETGNGSGSGGSGSGGPNSRFRRKPAADAHGFRTFGRERHGPDMSRPGSTVSVRMTRKTLPHGAKLALRYVTFALGKQSSA